MKNPFKKDEPVDTTQYEVRVQTYGGLVTNPYMSGIIAAGLNSQPFSQAAQIQQTQNAINSQMSQIAQAQQQLGAQNIWSTGYTQAQWNNLHNKSFTIEGETYSVSDDDYQYILKHGMDALKKREAYKDDFDKLIK